MRVSLMTGLLAAACGVLGGCGENFQGVDIRETGARPAAELADIEAACRERGIDVHAGELGRSLSDARMASTATNDSWVAERNRALLDALRAAGAVSEVAITNSTPNLRVYAYPALARERLRSSSGLTPGCTMDLEVGTWKIWAAPDGEGEPEPKDLAPVVIHKEREKVAAREVKR